MLNKKRDYNIDALKMMLIILVIYAHIPLLDGFVHNGVVVECDKYTWALVKGIYAFHMPLFVLISGYFSKSKTAAEQFLKSINFLKIFVVFHIVDLYINWCYSGMRPSLHDMIYPSFALWYLLCLFYWRMLISIIPPKWNAKWVLLSSIVFSISIGFVPIHGEMGFHRFFSFMPYFMIGHYYGKKIIAFVEAKIASITPPHIAMHTNINYCCDTSRII